MSRSNTEDPSGRAPGADGSMAGAEDEARGAGRVRRDGSGVAGRAGTTEGGASSSRFEGVSSGRRG